MPVPVEEREVVFSEETPTYKRIGGQDIAGNPIDAVQDIVEQVRDFDISPFMLKEFNTFEQTFIALMILKFHLMLAKQRDYGPGNISKAGVRGVVTRAQDKLERIKTLIGDPDVQVDKIKKILDNLPADATADEERLALLQIEKVANPSNAVGDERIDDTLMDLGNYGDIAYTVYHGAWGKELEENL